MQPDLPLATKWEYFPRCSTSPHSRDSPCGQGFTGFVPIFYILLGEYAIAGKLDSLTKTLF